MTDQEKVPAVLHGAFCVLQAVGEAGPAGANVAEVQVRTGLNQRTAYRHLSSLRALGMVTQAGERSRYRLGPTIAGLAQNTSDQREFLRRAQMFCEELAEGSREPVHATVCDQGTAVTVATASRSSPVSEKSPPIVPGSRRPLHASASGKVFIAYNRSALEAYSVRPLERFTEHTLTDLRDLERECLRVRRQGFAEDRQEYALGITCVAVPVIGVGGRAVGALTVSTKSAVMSGPRRAELLRALKPAAKGFSAAIGGESGA
ncbi:IclR family transcriptional regulator [Streptomyces sulphureus]|uniref:IclR family transcriptional regulator n=1 Tax=Streptomyces sulphureus TaxID=47758 RepID=UPI00035F2601|nr:IclR family transcriptional regulator [Streptomyces sulphureus]